MDQFTKLAELVGATAAPIGDGLPQTRKDARELGVTLYFTGRPCLRGHVAERFVSNGTCFECQRQYMRQLGATPERREYERQRNAKQEVIEYKRRHDRQRRATPEGKEYERQRRATPARKEYERQRALARTGDEILFAINQAEITAVSGRVPRDIITQCPEPQRSQLQALVDRVKADPQAGKAVVGLLRTMRELRKAELAELRSEP